MISPNSFDQIWVCDKQSTEGDCICVVLFDGRRRFSGEK